MFSFKTTWVLCLFLLLFSLLNFDFTTFTFWYSIKYLGNIDWEVLLLAKLGKLFTTEFLTGANTLYVSLCFYFTLNPYVDLIPPLAENVIIILNLEPPSLPPPAVDSPCQIFISPSHQRLNNSFLAVVIFSEQFLF